MMPLIEADLTAELAKCLVVDRANALPPRKSPYPIGIDHAVRLHPRDDLMAGACRLSARSSRKRP